MRDDTPPETPAPAFDLVGEAAARLRRFRASRDGEVVEQQTSLHRSASRWRLTLAIVLGTTVGPLASGDLLGLPAGAIIGALGSRWAGQGWQKTFALMAGVAVLAGLLGLFTHGFPGRPELRLGCWVLLLGLLAALAWALVRLAVPLPAAPDPDGETYRSRAGTTPEGLDELACRAARITAVNDAVKAARLRLLRLRLVALGSLAGWCLCLMAGFTLGKATVSPLPAAALLAALGGMVSALIAWREWGPLAGLLTYGISGVLLSMALMFAGLLPFSLFLTLWAWAGWVSVGSILGLLSETRDEAVPQRTS